MGLLLLLMMSFEMYIMYKQSSVQQPRLCVSVIPLQKKKVDVLCVVGGERSSLLGVGV